MKDNKTVCSAFWKHTNVRGGNRIFPCCRYKSSLQDFTGDVDNILHSKEYEQLRKDSLNAVKNSNCQKCYQEEELGKHSLRQWFNKNYARDEIKLEYLEAGFDNICNLACDGCWEEWSSSWWIKKNPNGVPKAGIISTEEFYNIPNTLEKIVFLGGEPFMTNRHRRLLSSITDLSKLSVTYYTNGMFDLHQKDIDLLQQCKDIHLIVSIDAYGELNNKVRQGSNWSQIENFIKTAPFRKTVNSVLHKNNWHGIEDLSKWINKTNLDWTVNILTYPSALCIDKLSKKEKQELEGIIKKIKIPTKEYILSFIKACL